MKSPVSTSSATLLAVPTIFNCFALVSHNILSPLVAEWNVTSTPEPSVPKVVAGAAVQSDPSNCSTFRLATLVVDVIVSGAVPSATSAIRVLAVKLKAPMSV